MEQTLKGYKMNKRWMRKAGLWMAVGLLSLAPARGQLVPLSPLNKLMPVLRPPLRLFDQHINPVKMVEANFSRSIANQLNIHIRILPVGDPAAVRLYVHYRQANGNWADVEATSEKMAGINWGFRSFYGYVACDSLEFAVKYHTSEGDFWDNNGGANYKVTRLPVVDPSWATGVIGQEVVLDSAGDGIVVQSYAMVLLRNISPNMRAGIRCTTDNWQTQRDIYAEGLFPADAARTGILRAGYVDYPNITGAFEFVAFSEDLNTGVKYWDNNFGQNYRINTGANWGAW